VVWGAIEGVDYFVNNNTVNWSFLIPLIGGIAIAFGNIALILRK
jgi:uncharacterized membrane protein